MKKLRGAGTCNREARDRDAESKEMTKRITIGCSGSPKKQAPAEPLC